MDTVRQHTGQQAVMFQAESLFLVINKVRHMFPLEVYPFDLIQQGQLLDFPLALIQGTLKEVPAKFGLYFPFITGECIFFVQSDPFVQTVIGLSGSL